MVVDDNLDKFQLNHDQHKMVEHDNLASNHSSIDMLLGMGANDNLDIFPFDDNHIVLELHNNLDIHQSIPLYDKLVVLDNQASNL